MATYEDESACPSLTFPTSPVPQYALVEVKVFRSLVPAISVGGAEERAQAPGWGSAGKGQFVLTWPELSNSAADTLWDFFVSAGGRHRTFTLHDPKDGTTDLGKFRFTIDMMSREQFTVIARVEGLPVEEA